MTCLLAACSDNISTDNLESLATNPDTRPDIVLVVADDMRWDLQSARGHQFLNTKAMDALAAEGAMMENAFVPMALCSPSRGVILTGRDVHASSAPRIAWRNNSFLDTQKTFIEYLKDAGYTTGYIGKWHMGDGSKPKIGFDHWESFDWLGDFFNPTIYVNGEKTSHSGYVDDILAQRATRFLANQRSSDKPVFLMVGLKAPHLAFEHPERYEDEFEDIDIPTPSTYNENFAVSGKLQSLKDWLGIENFHCGLNCFNDSWSQFIKYHYRAILGLDDAVGEIRAATELRGKKDNTLFIYTSDNGYSLGDHGLTEKHFVYEEPIRVPFLVDFPGDADTGRRFTELVSTLDIAPTVLDYATLDIPDYMPGKSLRKLLENAVDKDWRQELFLMYEKTQTAVRTDTHKLIKSLDTKGHYELYDLANDPKETINLYDDERYDSVRADMRRRLKSITNENQWTPRKSYPIGAVWVSDPMPTEYANALGASFSALTYQEFLDQNTNPNLSWRTEIRDISDPDSTFIFRDPPNAEQGDSILVAIPISRKSGWDPFIDFNADRTLFKDNFYTATIYVEGKEVWTNRAELPLNVPNPPLSKDETFVIIQFEDKGGLSLPLSLEAPEDTIFLPLENRLLGTAPNRFNMINSWHSHDNTELNRASEGLIVNWLGGEPLLRLGTDNIYLDEPSTLTVNLKSSKDTIMKAQWRSEYEEYSLENSASLNVQSSSEIQSLEFLIDGTSDIDSLRLEILDQNTEAKIESIQLTTIGGEALYNWDFTLDTNSQLSEDIQSLNSSDGSGATY